MHFLSQKPIVTYIAYEPYGKNFLLRFIEKYKKYQSGYDHDLVICFKQFKNKDAIEQWENIIIQENIKFIKFDDSSQINDFDIGSYFRLSEFFSERYILFLNTHCRPNSNNWLKIFLNHYKNRSVVGAFASMASLSSQFLNFSFDQHSKFQQIRWGLKHFLHVKLFPNPHIRTTGFFIKAEDLLALNIDRKKLIKKIYSNYFEGGRLGLSNQLLKKGFKLILVNSDDKSFSIDKWKYSETYNLGSQKKLLFIDNRTEEYEKANDLEKNKRTNQCWGHF